ncbi:acyltransferase [Janthinobacterium rivuli]|uniref:Acyltransferase n=1 Tax=Janthinobacterium rivuli TaxID=2751478 RepID=A0ABY8I677_9BURK|nr:acyltransferase [Janthinobacterium rivuli]WFR79432.1 acyltransferase [Janthinobacterium rivuli]
MNNNRLGNLDALRGLCAIFVFFQHALPSEFLGRGYFSEMPNFYVDLGRIGVGAFFLVSGYVIPFSIKKNSTLQSFWIGRLFRLWPAYIVSIIFALLFNVENSSMLGFFSIALNFTMLQQFFGVKNALGVYWTLQIELIFYFVISLMFLTKVIFDYKKVRAAFYISLVFTLVFSVIRFIFEIKLPVALPIALSLMFFATDLRFSRLKSEPISIFRASTLIIVLIVSCHFSYGANVGSDDNPYRFILAYFLAVSLFFFFEKCREVPRYLVFFGSISYSFYLMHPIVLSFFHSENLNFFSILIAFLFVVGVSTLSWWFIEKPFQRIGRNINNDIFASRTQKS